MAASGVLPASSLRSADSSVPVTRPHRLLATGLNFPEGPVALADGSVLLVEVARQTLTRVNPKGGVEVVARVGGGPNGAAIGPDGFCYICNNGGEEFEDIDGILLPVEASSTYEGGWIDRVDLRSGKVERVYQEVQGQPLSAPNDLVFDNSGGFWFTDIGKTTGRSSDHGSICYARADGSAIKQVIYPVNAPNGIGLSPDGRTLYFNELYAGRLIAFDVTGPGELSGARGIFPGRFIAAGPGRYLFDSMAVEANGTVCIAAPIPGEIVCFAPDGELVERLIMPGPLPTNICFGGADLKTAFITLSGKGELIAMYWPRAGLAPSYTA